MTGNSGENHELEPPEPGLREIIRENGEPIFIQTWACAPPQMWQAFHVTGEQWSRTGTSLPVRTILEYRLADAPRSENTEGT